MKRVFLILFLLFSNSVFSSCSGSKTIDVKKKLEIPQTKEGAGIVYGYLLNATNRNPVKGTPFLARNLSSKDPENPATISFSLQSDPRAVYNEETGEFYFEDIEPGDNYVIILHYGPGNIFVVQGEGTNYPLTIEVESGKASDIGMILVPE